MITEGCPVAPASIQRLLAVDEWAPEHQSEIFSDLRDVGPVVWISEPGAFAVNEHDVVVEALSDPDRFSSELGNPRGPRALAMMERASRELADDPTARELLSRLVPDWRAAPVLLATDPPQHTAGSRSLASNASEPSTGG